MLLSQSFHVLRVPQHPGQIRRDIFEMAMNGCFVASPFEIDSPHPSLESSEVALHDAFARDDEHGESEEEDVVAQQPRCLGHEFRGLSK